MKTLNINIGSDRTYCSFLDGTRIRFVEDEKLGFIPSDVCVVSCDHIAVGHEASILKEKYPEYFERGFLRYIDEPVEINGVGYRQILTAFIKHAVSGAGNDVDRLRFVLQQDLIENSGITEILEQSAADAGIPDVKFVAEPTAIWQSYAHDCGDYINGKILTYSIGAGMFECAVVETDEEREYATTVCSARTPVGGSSIDELIFLKAQSDADRQGQPLDDDSIYSDFEKCRRIKEMLSKSEKTTVVLSDSSSFELTREELETLSAPVFDKTFEAIDAMLSKASIQHRDISHILLAGGTANIPVIRIRLKKHFGAYGAYEIDIPQADCELATLSCHGAALCDLEMRTEHPRLAYGDVEYPLTSELATVGRGDDMDIVIDVDNLQRFSRHHFDIIVRKEQKRTKYFLRNCSGQMTFVGGMVVGAFGCDEVELRDNAVITAGKLRFTFKIK